MSSYKQRVVIFCESYPSIAYTLYRIDREKSDIPITIFIAVLKDLYDLFQMVNEKVYGNKVELVYYEPYKQRSAEARGLKKLLYIIPDILGERRYLKKFYNKHFAQLENAEVLFSSPGYSGAKIYALSRLSKKNRLVFIDPGPIYMAKYSPRSLLDLTTLFLFKIRYGKNTQIGQFPPENPWSKGFPYLSKSFRDKIVKSSIDWSNRDKIMETFDWEKFRIYDTGEKKVIYFHQDLVGGYVPNRDLFSRELNAALEVILRYYPENEIARKYHPAHELNKDVIKIGEEIPVYIPAEFLYNGDIQVYLGISSNAIVNVRGGQAISLIDLITFKKDEVKERLKARIVKASHSEILFPASLEELDEMLADISGKKA